MVCKCTIQASAGYAAWAGSKSTDVAFLRTKSDARKVSMNCNSVPVISLHISSTNCNRLVILDNMPPAVEVHDQQRTCEAGREVAALQSSPPSPGASSIQESGAP